MSLRYPQAAQAKHGMTSDRFETPRLNVRALGKAACQALVPSRQRMQTGTNREVTIPLSKRLCIGGNARSSVCPSTSSPQVDGPQMEDDIDDISDETASGEESGFASSPRLSTFSTLARNETHGQASLRSGLVADLHLQSEQLGDAVSARKAARGGCAHRSVGAFTAQARRIANLFDSDQQLLWVHQKLASDQPVASSAFEPTRSSSSLQRLSLRLRRILSKHVHVLCECEELATGCGSEQLRLVLLQRDVYERVVGRDFLVLPPWFEEGGVVHALHCDRVIYVS
mmetsp:Transcript_14200/g.27715  ORF Transcript_14200/g.27715 Transcript_14200/m.27715 type:complete len:285 (-) Transcript_14200:267-1121(-)